MPSRPQYIPKISGAPPCSSRTLGSLDLLSSANCSQSDAGMGDVKCGELTLRPPGFHLIYEGSRRLSPASLKDIQFGLEKVSVNGEVSRVGFIQLEVIDVDKLSSERDKTTHLKNLAFLLFTAEHSVSSGPWQCADFESQKAILLGEVLVERPWRGNVEQSLVPIIFDLEASCGASVMLAWSHVFQPDRLDLFREVGFRRVANSDLFCMSRDPAHPSRSVPVDWDAPFITQPIPIPRSVGKIPMGSHTYCDQERGRPKLKAKQL
ncbi:hypothetical protein DFH09DRAFT_1176349 [Mycena vulgaris]|nr:hypothetical protein DFH09DRAFT_1176349 [Mycena vulgaris]